MLALLGMRQQTVAKRTLIAELYACPFSDIRPVLVFFNCFLFKIDKIK